MSVQAWVDERVPTSSLHLDAAAAGRPSVAALDAEVAFLRDEAVRGAYVAEAALDLAPARAALGSLVGLAGSDVFLAEGAASAFARLLGCWPLKRGARLGVVPSEYGGNALVLEQLSRERGWELVELPVDGWGRVADVPSGLDLVTFPHVASQRGVAQPVDLVREAGVPLVLDVAQSAGQVDVPRGAAAYAGTSRKWLCGPRGVGFGVVDPGWQDRLAPLPVLGAAESQGMAAWDSGESHVAGRLALGVAARGWSPALVPVIAAAGAAARVLLEGAAGWSVVEPVDEPTGITTLQHPTADPVATRAALLERGVLVSAVPTTRSADLGRAVLRVSTHAWVTPGDLERLAGMLESATAG